MAFLLVFGRYEGPPKGLEGIFSWGGCENVFEAKVGDNGSWETRTVRRASWRHHVDGPTELASMTTTRKGRFAYQFQIVVFLMFWQFLAFLGQWVRPIWRLRLHAQAAAANLLHVRAHIAQTCAF